jgi:hypothetical protein
MNLRLVIHHSSIISQFLTIYHLTLINVARPHKNNANYFPHDNNMWSDKKIVAIRNKFGLIGYAVWNLLLETLCESANFAISFSDSEVELLANYWGLDPAKLKDIFDLMERLSLIKIDNGKLWSEKLRKRLKPVLEERKRKRKWSRKRWQKDGSSKDLDDDNEVLDGSNLSNSEELDDNNEVLDGSNPSNSEELTASSILKESKVNKSKVKESKLKKSKKKRNTPKKIFGGSSFEILSSKSFLEKQSHKEQIKFLIEKRGENEILQEWADEVRKLREIDEWTEKQIQIVFEYTAQHDFWKDQILSVKKFRQKNKAGVPYFVVIVDELGRQSEHSKIADFSN